MAALISCIRKKHTPVVSGYICSQGSVPTHTHTVSESSVTGVFPGSRPAPACKRCEKGGGRGRKKSAATPRNKNSKWTNYLATISICSRRQSPCFDKAALSGKLIWNNIRHVGGWRGATLGRRQRRGGDAQSLPLAPPSPPPRLALFDASAMKMPTLHRVTPLIRLSHAGADGGKNRYVCLPRRVRMQRARSAPTTREKLLLMFYQLPGYNWSLISDPCLQKKTSCDDDEKKSHFSDWAEYVHLEACVSVCSAKTEPQCSPVYASPPFNGLWSPFLAAKRTGN